MFVDRNCGKPAGQVSSRARLPGKHGNAYGSSLFTLQPRRFFAPNIGAEVRCGPASVSTTGLYRASSIGAMLAVSALNGVSILLPGVAHGFAGHIQAQRAHRVGMPQR